MAEIGQPGSAAAGLEAREEDGALVLYLSGELDVTNVKQVRSAVDAFVSSQTERLIFDLEGLQFMDSSGIALLVSVAQKVRKVQVRNPSGIVRRLMELTGLTDTLHVTPSGPVSLSSFPRCPAGKQAAPYRTMFSALDWGMSRTGRRQEGGQGDGR